MSFDLRIDLDRRFDFTLLYFPPSDSLWFFITKIIFLFLYPGVEGINHFILWEPYHIDKITFFFDVEEYIIQAQHMFIRLIHLNIGEFYTVDIREYKFNKIEF